MASEMRRAARALVEPTPAHFEVPTAPEETLRRLQAATSSGKRLAGHVAADRLVLGEAARAKGLTTARYEGRCVARPGGARLEGSFMPPPGIPRFLRAISLLLAALLVASVLLLAQGEPGDPIRLLVPLGTFLAILGFPLLVLALSSQKQASESRVARAIHALFTGDEDHK